MWPGEGLDIRRLFRRERHVRRELVHVCLVRLEVGEGAVDVEQVEQHERPRVLELVHRDLAD